MVNPNVSEKVNYYEDIFEVASQGIIYVNHEGIILRVNPAFEKILGYKEHEVLGKSFFSLAYTNQKMMHITSHNPLSRFYQSEKDNMEMTLLDKEGHNIPVRFQAVLIRDEHNQVKQAIGIIEHMVELKGTDETGDSLAEKMWEAQQNFDNILNNSADAILILDITGNIMTVNKAFLQMLGYTQEEVIEKHIVEISASEEGTFVTTMGDEIIIDREYINNTSQKSVELYEKGCVKNWETHFVRKDKVIVPIEATLSILNDKNGDRRGSIVIARDITGRRRKDKEIKESRDFLEKILEDIADGILISDPSGVIINTNSALERMIGLRKADLTGEHISILVKKDKGIRERFIERLEALFKTGHISYETVVDNKEGKHVEVDCNCSLIKNEKGEYIAGVTVLRNITERKEQEEKLKKAYAEMEVRIDDRTAELKESNKQLQQEIGVREVVEQKLIEAKEIAESANNAKSEFLANMSHELRTPLNHIIGFTELVVDKKFGDINEIQEEYLGDVLRSSKHLLSVINDILDLSKVEAGKLELKASSFDPRILIDNSLMMFKEKSLKNGIELSSDIDHIPEKIIADERKLKQILYNLLSNAVKFTSGGGKVCLSAQLVDCIIRSGLRSGDPESLKIIVGENGKGKVKGRKYRKCVKLSISDTGIGVKPEDQYRIFSPFEQVDGSTSRRYEGTGLGLPLTRKLVELHNGRIWVESEGEGKGSTFSFLIPL